MNGIELSDRPLVAPHMGAWIETHRGADSMSSHRRSHPMWVRGLKHIYNH